MKKIVVLTLAKDAFYAVDRLRSAGILHVEHQRQPKGKSISELHDNIVLANSAAAALGEFQTVQREIGDWKAAAKHIVDLKSRQEQTAEYCRNLQISISEWKVWGDFDPQRVQLLGEKGVHIALYHVPKAQLKMFPAGIILRRVKMEQGMAYCIVVSRQRIELPFKELALPKTGLYEMENRLEEGSKVAALITGELKEQAKYRAALMDARRSLEKELEFQEALSGMADAGEIVYLSGYIPCDTVKAFSGLARQEKWGYVISDPGPEDNVPTLIRNPRWVSLINPVFRLMEATPGYRELDISLWFLIFFSIFFGMLIGDAGVGTIFIALTALMQFKFRKRPHDKMLFVFFYLLSACAVIWGAMTGTFFGQAWLPPSVKPLVPALRSDRNVQVVCFFLGATHLTIAHSWRALLKMPGLIALADIGWILVLWGGFFLAKMLVLGDAFPVFGKWLFISGALLIALFTNPTRNIFKCVGSGLGSLALNIVNSFTDVLSYIRLFAVGLAGVAIADSFNNMAMEIGYKNILTAAVACFVLLIGHGLNVLLGPIAVVVHGVRLNILEFCNHLDIKWSGVPYKPLKKIST